MPLSGQNGREGLYKDNKKKKKHKKDETKSSAGQRKTIEHCVICNNRKTLCFSLSTVSIRVPEAEHVLGVISKRILSALGSC